MGNDLLAIVAYSLYDCCEACANMNLHFTGSDACRALTFQANMTLANATSSPGGVNCWLKDKSTDGVPWENGIIVGAILQNPPA